jgi:hypothetical protein
MTIECKGIYYFTHFTETQYLAKNPSLLPKVDCPALKVPEDHWGVLNWWNVLDDKFQSFYLQSEPKVVLLDSEVVEITYIHNSKLSTLQKVTQQIYDASVKKLLKSPEDCDSDEKVQSFLVGYNSYKGND